MVSEIKYPYGFLVFFIENKMKKRFFQAIFSRWLPWALGGIILTGWVADRYNLPTRLFSYLRSSTTQVKTFDIDKIDAHENEIIAYHYYLTQINSLETYLGKLQGLPLPGNLIISPGVYKIYGKRYLFEKEGLYRVIYPGIANEQRIVYENNLDALLSGICWIVSHGNRDNGKSFNDLMCKAMESKLILICGDVSTIAHSILTNLGIQSRLVIGLTLDKWNNYDNGHTLIEVYKNKKWVVYDLDQNVKFKDAAKELCLIEWISKIPSNNYEIEQLSSDTRISILGFKDKNAFDYSLLSECLCCEKQLRRWYQRVMMIPIIQKGACFYFTSPKQFQSKIESYSSNYRYVDRGEFMSRFYQN